MGFMSETKIIAGSSSYNLAGAPENRGNYLTNTVLSLVVSGRGQEIGLGKGIVDAHMAGPAVKYRRFYRWAITSGFNDLVGNYKGVRYAQQVLSDAGFNFIAPLPGMEKRVVTYNVGSYNPEFIAMALISQYRPERMGVPFDVEQEMHWVPAPPGMPMIQQLYVPTGRLIVQWQDTNEVAYFESNVESNRPGMFAYVIYEKRNPRFTVTSDSGVVEVDSESEFPSMVGSSVNTTPDLDSVALNKTVVTTVTRPDMADDVSTVTSTSYESYDSWVKVRLLHTETPATPTSNQSTKDITQTERALYRLEDVVTTDTTTEEIDDPADPTKKITVTTTVETTEQELVPYFTYRRQVVDEQLEPWQPPVYVYYQEGTNAYGDSVMFSGGAEERLFFPVIPVRRFNVSIKSDTFPDQYAWNRRAVRKAFGSKKQYNDIVKSLESSDSIEDVDHAWLVFGVSLGAKTDEALVYLYEFFKGIADGTPVTSNIRNAEDVVAAWDDFVEKIDETWNYGEMVYQPSDDNYVQSTLKPPAVEQFQFYVQAQQGQQNWEYNIAIAGKGGGKVIGSGMSPYARGKVGNCWVRTDRSITIQVPEYHPSTGGDGGTEAFYSFSPSTSEVICFGKQLTATVWEEYEFFDLIHTNHVYQGKNVITRAAKALATEDENTGFIIPLHEGAMRESGLIDRTQLSMECAHMVLNYYEKQKIPWYASGFFKMITIVVVIVVSVYTGGAAAGGAGVLGTNAAVGAAIGFAGTAAVVAGAIANAVAAALVSAIISKVSTMLLGDKLGALVGAIVSMVVINLSTTGGEFSMSDMFDGLTKADNMLKMTLGGISTITDHLNAKTMALGQEIMEMQTEYQQQMEEIQKLTNELMGNGVDAQMITSAIRYASEKPESFLARTTMTGDDIVTSTIKLVENFPDAQLTLPEM